MAGPPDRKSTRLNSSHLVISYAVFCLKKKNAALVAIRLCSAVDCALSGILSLPRAIYGDHELRSRFARVFFFFNDTATTEIYTLSLHDALPISRPPITITRGARAGAAIAAAAA